MQQLRENRQLAISAEQRREILPLLAELATEKGKQARARELKSLVWARLTMEQIALIEQSRQLQSDKAASLQELAAVFGASKAAQLQPWLEALQAWWQLTWPANSAQRLRHALERS